MVPAYWKGISVSDGVLLDRMVLSSKNEQKALALAAGMYQVLSRNRNGGRLLKEIRIE